MKERKETQNNENESLEKPLEKKRKPRNLWPLKAALITLCLSFAFNLVSELVLRDTALVFAILLTVIIMFLGIFFDIIGTAATACDMEPLFSMASRKIKGAKTAVKMVKNSDIVASVCCDIIGDICGIISGICGAAIVLIAFPEADLFLSVLVYALISTLTIAGKAVGKNIAVSKSTDIVMSCARILSIFDKK